jgi:hypothetical protein
MPIYVVLYQVFHLPQAQILRRFAPQNDNCRRNTLLSERFN